MITDAKSRPPARVRLFVREAQRVRFHEVDGYRVVHNARMHVYFDVGRFKMLSTFFHPVGDLTRTDYTFPVVRDSCKFERFARLDEVLTIETVFDYQPPLRVGLLRFEHRVFVKGSHSVASGYSEVGICDGNLKLYGQCPPALIEHLEQRIIEESKRNAPEVRVLGSLPKLEPVTLGRAADG